jgi:glycosyltransferase involved in cell wall biosynthesis
MSKNLIVQRFLPSYRKEVAKYLSENGECEYIIGTNVEFSKAKNSETLEGINYTQLKMYRFKVFGREFYYQRGLLRLLIRKSPKNIITEAESALLSYFIVLFYRHFINRKCKVTVWCFYALPGLAKPDYIIKFKLLLWRLCDKYLSYHNFGKKFLISKKFKSEQIFVAVNVGETEKYKKLRTLYDSKSPEKARTQLGLQNRFTIAYIGSLTSSKKPQILLGIAKELHDNKINLLFIGGGPLESLLSQDSNCYTYVKWTNNLLDYFCGIDLIILPGRGGIIISEALTLGIPIMAHEADGVELDLINHQTGKLINSVEKNNLLNEIINFRDNFDSQSELYKFKCRELIDTRFNSRSMGESIIKCLE